MTIRSVSLLALTLAALLTVSVAWAGIEIEPIAKTPDLQIEAASVKYLEDLDLLVFELRVAGRAGGTQPKARGQMHRAPVLGYVFPTTLAARDVGFGEVEGIVALAVTSHPDFDDTPLWDENGDRRYDNDGKIFHTHWVVLGKDARVPGGLSVKEFDQTDSTVVLPPTHPGMPMYLDSPGFSVLTRQKTLRVLVPTARVGQKKGFRYDAVAAYMEVNGEDPKRPMLGVYEVYSVLSGDLRLPYEVQH